MIKLPQKINYKIKCRFKNEEEIKLKKNMISSPRGQYRKKESKYWKGQKKNEISLQKKKE